MKEIPILFSTEMVQAILDGRKTQTRRVIKPQPEVNGNRGKFPAQASYKGFWAVKHIGKWIWPTEDGEHFKFSPYGKPGDLLYVRETFADVPFEHHQKYHGYAYKADFGDEPVDWNWKPSIHMPKEASRIWLKVKDVRVERVKDITEQDAIAEGVNGKREAVDSGLTWYDKPLRSFRFLWDSINAKRENGEYSWESNPWVWVVEFEVVSTTGKPEDK